MDFPVNGMLKWGRWFQKPVLRDKKHCTYDIFTKEI
jgi:hypothetical protein